MIERQTIEVDADRRSAWSRIDSIRRTIIAGNLLPWSGMAASAGPMLFCWAFATGWLFRIFGDAKFAGDDLTATPYPPMPIRRALAYASGFGGVQFGWDPTLLPVARAEFSRAARETEVTFSLVTGEPLSTDGMDDAFGPVGKEHALRLWGNWERDLGPRLAPFAYEPDRGPSGRPDPIPGP